MSSQSDALGYAQQLEATGVPKNQADVHARVLADVLGKLEAFPLGLARLETTLLSKMEAETAKMASRIDLLEEKLTSRIDAGEAKLISRIETGEAKLTSRIEAGEARMIGRIEAGDAQLSNRIDAGNAQLNSRIEASEERMICRMDAIELKGNTERAEMRGDITMLKWMVGTSVALNIGVLLKVLIP